MKSNLIKYFLLSLLILTVFSLSSCYLYKYNLTSLKKEVKSYNGWKSTLKLFDNNIFKVYTASDIMVSPGHFSSVTSGGEYEYKSNKLILKYRKPAEYTDTLFYVIWGTRIFLMDKLDITFTANELNMNYFSPHSYWGWYESQGKYVFGLPLFPEPFNRYLIKDSIFANVINIDSVEVTIDKGENDGLYYGCELTDGDNLLAVEYLYPDSSVLIPAEVFLFDEYSKLRGEDIIAQDSLIATYIKEGQLNDSKYYYIPGCKKY